jgi:dihydropteroate synthase
LDPPVVMGILNLTPDSFSDGGATPGLTEQLVRARAMVEAGAGIIDVGGESTRPGAASVPADEEIRRILPFVQAFAPDSPVPLSVDTRKAAVAAAALDAGAEIVNDVSGLRFDPGMAGVVARTGAGLVLMHMRGTPADMVERADYEDVIPEVVGELEVSLAIARREGVEDRRIVLDPGIGFAKSADHSLRALDGLAGLGRLGFPILVGPSRKSFIGAVTGAPAEDRIPGTVAACVMAFERGASVFRVHDVGAVVQALAVARAVTGSATRSVTGPETLR